MKTEILTPDQIITLNDYPVYSDDVLIEYFNSCRLGKEVALVPVIRTDLVRKHLDQELIATFEDFEKENGSAEYFMLDGSHRTTALTLAGCRIRAVIYEKDQDIAEARKLVAQGKILDNDTLNHSIDENCNILNRHFKERPYFMTVKQKTEKMVQEGILPTSLSD